VRGVDLGDAGAGAGVHEPLEVGVDGLVLAGQQGVRGDGAEALDGARVGDGLGVGRALSGREVGGRRLVQVAGEGRAELGRVDDDLGAVGNLSRHQRQRRGGPGGEFADGLALGRDETGDVDQ
jgi:hypothetical protein